MTFCKYIVKIFKDRHSDLEFQDLCYHLEVFISLKVTSEGKFWMPNSFAF